MKKLAILLVCCSIFMLSSCGTKDNADIERAKQELLGNVPVQETVENTDSENNQNNQDEEKNEEKTQDEEKNFVKTKNITSDPIIQFDNLQVTDFEDLEAEITGKANGKVEKITVLFSNPDSTLPNGEPYTLGKFKSGDSTFLYNARKKYDSLDYGLNTYLVTAFADGKKHQVELQVYIKNPKNKTDKNQEKKSVPVKTDPLQGKAVNIDNLPKSGAYGNPVKLGNGNITYSDIKGLEITDIGEIDLIKDADKITDYLKEHQK